MSEEAKLIQNLKDSGCDAEFIFRFLRLIDSRDCDRMLAMLADQRDRLLGAIRADERRMYCLDLLVSRIKDGVGREKKCD